MTVQYRQDNNYTVCVSHIHKHTHMYAYKHTHTHKYKISTHMHDHIPEKTRHTDLVY